MKKHGNTVSVALPEAILKKSDHTHGCYIKNRLQKHPTAKNLRHIGQARHLKKLYSLMRALLAKKAVLGS